MFVGGLKFRVNAAVVLLFLLSSCANKPGIIQASDKASISIVEYLVRNPESTQKILDSLAAHQEKVESGRKAEQIVRNKERIFSTTQGSLIGNPSANVKVAIFSDYNCAFCKKASIYLNDNVLVKSGVVAVVVREFPILGEDSVKAARLALAAAKLHKYSDFHNALMHAEKGAATKIDDRISTTGLDRKRLEAVAASSEISEEVAKNLDLARELGVQSTPTIIVGTSLLRGWSERALDAAIQAELDKVRPSTQ